MMRIVGLDPGLATLGLADVVIGPGGVERAALYTFRTTKESKKRKLRVADENAERLGVQFDRIARVIGDDVPAVIVAESVSFPRSSSAAAKIAMAWGAFVAFARLNGCALLQLTPQELKSAVTGSKSASKGDVEGALRAAWPALCEPVDHQGKPVPATAREHAFDALAAVHAALDSDVVRALRRSHGFT